MIIHTYFTQEYFRFLMKKLRSILVLFTFACLSYLNFSYQESQPIKKTENEFIQDSNIYRDGILRSELNKVSSVANYDIKVELIPDEKKIVAEEKLTWINKTPFPTSEIQIHLYPNAFKSSNTLFARGRGIKITRETRSSIEFSEIKINNEPAQLFYFQTEAEDRFDSTVAKIILNHPAIPGDTIKINFKYSTAVPKAGKRFGYAEDRNFFFISQWFPKAGVFQNGKWICSPYFPFTNFYSDFGKYNVSITVPGNYSVAATGVQTSDIKNKYNKSTFKFIQEGVLDFAWMASDDIVLHNAIYRRNDSSEIKIKLAILPEDEKYQNRFINAVKNALRYFENNIGIYPYHTITVVDVPAATQAGGMEYPTLITTGAELFSPVETFQPESVTVHEFVHQFFYGIVANNEVYDAWLDEGLTSYLSSKIVEIYYGKGLLNFKFLRYYPVFGLNFLSYNEIPLVYTLGSFTLPRGANMLKEYYQAPTIASILDTSYKLPNSISYSIEAYSKPELVLISLERFFGYRKMIKILREYYKQYKFKHPTSDDFLSVIRKNTNGDFEWIYENLFKGSSTFDYKVKYVRPSDNENEYEVLLERSGDGIFKQDIALYTDRDTIFKSWDGKERWGKIIFKTKNIVKGAEIDPYKKNILDLNYANNSYILNRQFGGSLRLSFRFLFWFQNLLLILGSVS